MFCWKIVIVKINYYGTFATHTRRCCSTLLALTNLIPRNYFMRTVVPGSVLQWRIWSAGRVKHVAKATPSFLEAEKAPAPVFLREESHGQREPGGLRSVGSQRVRPDWQCEHTPHPHGSAGVKLLLSGRPRVQIPVCYIVYTAFSPERAWSINFHTQSNSLQTMISLSCFLWICFF